MHHFGICCLQLVWTCHFNYFLLYRCALWSKVQLCNQQIHYSFNIKCTFLRSSLISLINVLTWTILNRNKCKRTKSQEFRVSFIPSSFKPLNLVRCRVGPEPIAGLQVRGVDPGRTRPLSGSLTVHGFGQWEEPHADTGKACIPHIEMSHDHSWERTQDLHAVQRRH